MLIFSAREFASGHKYFSHIRIVSEKRFRAGREVRRKGDKVAKKKWKTVAEGRIRSEKGRLVKKKIEAGEVGKYYKANYSKRIK